MNLWRLLMVIWVVRADEPTMVHTRYGDVLGYETDMARVFYGIPFARPPVKRLRWNPPVPIGPWAPKVVNATSRAPACSQPSCNPASPFCPPFFSEDCLYLNIFTPRTSSSLLPVMIFIPGGEFQALDASSSVYNSERLVNTTQTILVFIQYRLGVLGFLATGTGPNDLKGNYGILDQRLAIAWIKANIDAFGGDPNAITLFGQSAGAQSVALHYVTDEMQTFFQRAIVQSAPMSIPFRTYAQYVTPCVLLAEQLRCAIGDLACFRAASPEDLIAAQIVVDRMITSLQVLLFFEPWVPVIDHRIVHGQLYQTVQNVSFALKPLMIGSVLDEGLSFIYKQWTAPITPVSYAEIAFAFFGEQVFEVLARFPPTGMTDQRPRLSQIATQWVFACPTRLFARRAATYAYVFGSPLSVERRTSNEFCHGHVCHSDELPFLFESRWRNFTGAQQRLSESMASYWTNFAKSGDPEEPLRVPVPWPRLTNISEQYMDFRDPLQVRVDYLKDECDFWDRIGY